MTTNLNSPHSRASCAAEAPMYSDNLVATVGSSVGNVFKNKLLKCTSPSGVNDRQSSDEDDDMLPPSPVHSYQAIRKTPVCQRSRQPATVMAIGTTIQSSTSYNPEQTCDVAPYTVSTPNIGQSPKLSPRDNNPSVNQVCVERPNPASSSWMTADPNIHAENVLGSHEANEANGRVRATGAGVAITCGVLDISDLPTLAENRKISRLISSHQLSGTSPSSSQYSQDLLRTSPFRDPDSDGGFVECFQTQDIAGSRQKTPLNQPLADSSLDETGKWPSSGEGMCSAEATHSLLENSMELVMEQPSQEPFESTAHSSDRSNRNVRNPVGERNNLIEDMSSISAVDRQQRQVCSQEGTPDMSVKEPILFEAATRVYDPRERRWVLRSYSKLLSFPMLEIALSQPVSDHVRLGLFDTMDWEESIPGSGMESFAETLQKHPHSSSSGYIGDISNGSRSESQRISRFSIASSIFESVPIACSSVLSRNSLEMDGKFAMPKRPVQPKQLVQSSMNSDDLTKSLSPRSPSSSKEETEGSPFLLSQSSLTSSDLEATTPQAPCSARTPEAATANPSLNPPTKDQESIDSSTGKSELPSTGRKRGRKPKIPDVIKENEDDSSAPSTPIQKGRRGRPPLTTPKNTDMSKSASKTPTGRASGGSDGKEENGMTESGEQAQNSERQAADSGDGEGPPDSKSSEEYLKEAENAWRESRQRSFEPGKPVFAQWTDKFYYAATIIQRDTLQSEKWAVRFEDGQIRSLVEEFILPYSVLSKKQSVLVLNESLTEGQSGIVIGFDKITNQHMVELDIGHQTLKVQRKRICMTQDQVKMWNEAFLVPQLFSPHTCNVSLDNIVSGRRRRTNTAPAMSPLVKTPRTPSSKAEASPGPTTPKTNQGKQQPSSVGRPSLRKKIVGKRDMMMDSSTFSESSSAQLIEEEQELRTRIKNRCLGAQPSSATAAGSAHESEEEALSVEADPLTNVSLGPLPENDQLFVGYYFILTKATRMLEVDPEDVSDELEPYLEPTMYVKDHLRRQLIAGGGKILERFDHSQLLEDDDTVLVVCNRPCRTERYIRSLAARIRAVSHDWVIHCCQRNEKIPHSRYLLPPGIDLHGHIVEWSSSTGRCFVGTRILLHGPPDFNDLWIPILVQAECVIVSCLPIRTTKRIESANNGATEASQQDPQDRPASALHDDVPFDYVVTTKDCPDRIVQQAHRMRTPLCSTMWLIQSLIHGKLLDPQSNEEFHF